MCVLLFRALIARSGRRGRRPLQGGCVNGPGAAEYGGRKSGVRAGFGGRAFVFSAWGTTRTRGYRPVKSNGTTQNTPVGAGFHPRPGVYPPPASRCCARTVGDGVLDVPPSRFPRGKNKRSTPKTTARRGDGDPSVGCADSSPCAGEPLERVDTHARRRGCAGDGRKGRWGRAIIAIKNVPSGRFHRFPTPRPWGERLNPSAERTP